MCRHIAFPPGFPRKDAEAMLYDMYGGNDDGTGSVYLRGTHFEVNKWPLSYDEVLKQNLPLFHHMPSKSWTVAHVRLKTHGQAEIQNTHPFIKGKYAITHNGVWHDSKLARQILKDFVPLKGETDSEVAAWLISKWGPVDFWHNVSGAGVYLALERDGGLWAINNSYSGDLVLVNSNYGCVVSSEVPKSWKRHQVKVNSDWIHLGKDGQPDRSSGSVLAEYNRKKDGTKEPDPMMMSQRIPTLGNLNSGSTPTIPNVGSDSCPWCTICFLYHAPGVHQYPAIEKERREKMEREEREALERMQQTTNPILTKEPISSFLKRQIMEHDHCNDWSERSYELEAYND